MLNVIFNTYVFSNFELINCTYTYSGFLPSTSADDDFYDVLLSHFSNSNTSRPYEKNCRSRLQIVKVLNKFNLQYIYRFYLKK